MDTGGSRELGKPGDAGFDLGRCDHHEVGELVDDRDNVGQSFGNLRAIVEHGIDPLE